MEWLPIESAPKDGGVVYVKRVHERRIVTEGEAVFGELHAAAPGRSSLGPDPLGRLTAADYAREAAQTAEWAANKKWLNPDRMHAFPSPTHWSPDKTAELRASDPPADWVPEGYVQVKDGGVAG